MRALILEGKDSERAQRDQLGDALAIVLLKDAVNHARKVLENATKKK